MGENLGGILQIRSAGDARANPRAKCTCLTCIQLGSSIADGFRVDPRGLCMFSSWPWVVHHSAGGGHGVAAGIAEMIVKNSSLGVTRISVLKRGRPDRQHGSARWSRACQLAAQSSCGEVLTAHAARGKMGENDPPCGRASDLYAAPRGGRKLKAGRERER